MVCSLCCERNESFATHGRRTWVSEPMRFPVLCEPNPRSRAAEKARNASADSPCRPGGMPMPSNCRITSDKLNPTQALKLFRKCCGKVHLDEITGDDLREFKVFLRSQKNVHWKED